MLPGEALNISSALKPAFRPEGCFGCLPRPATIREIRVENYRIKTFVLDAAIPQAQPGQFVMVWLPAVEEAPFSLAYHTPVTLTVARVGQLTEAMHRLEVGDRLWLRGPYGHPFRAEADVQRPLLVGGGYGVAPLAFLAEVLLARGQHPLALVGGRTAADIIGLERFERLGIPTIVTTEDGSRGEQGVVLDPLARLLESRLPWPGQDGQPEKAKGDALYGVGPHGLLEALERLARVHKLPAQLSWEATIGCAVGLCGMCEHTDGSLLCVEGPVLKS
jgi:dihydroorotate dehydrogenase electron transfer subunit